MSFIISDINRILNEHHYEFLMQHGIQTWIDLQSMGHDFLKGKETMYCPWNSDYELIHDSKIDANKSLNIHAKHKEKSLLITVVKD